MESVVGHYGYLEYISGSQFSSRFPFKAVTYAREIVKRSQESIPVYDAHHEEDFAVGLSETELDPNFRNFMFGDWSATDTNAWLIFGNDTQTGT
ncbi:hypothetical protein NX059_005975 [Plenodomus lindquistii]|nr:hypothetical protein NX059_005975 [Plenodomus lindquistii]